MTFSNICGRISAITWRILSSKGQAFVAYPHRPMTLHSPTENSLAVLNHKILEANSQVRNVKLPFMGSVSVRIGRLNPAFGSSRSASSAYQSGPLVTLHPTGTSSSREVPSMRSLRRGRVTKASPSRLIILSNPTCLSINRLWHELCDMLRRLVGTTAPWTS
ncbi:hypothetical protein TNCV_4970111 [Trichonephila clavipes]|nr:hypothetical protein TNCV_4970111 [Trichonephila clavipes]